MKSRKTYRFGPAGVPRPIVPPPVPFSVEPSRPTEVCLAVTDGQFDLMRKRWGETPTPSPTPSAPKAKGPAR